MQRNLFRRNVAVLMSGTGIAQILTILSSPLLTRLFSGEQYGVLGLFTSTAGVVTVVAALRYELALVLPEDDRDASTLLMLCLGLLLGVGGLVAIVVIAWGSHLGDLLESAELTDLLWLLPAYVVSTGLYNVASYWSTRRRAFGRLAISRVTRSGGQIISQVFAGLLGLGSLGLVGGQVLGQLIAAGVLGIQTWASEGRRIIRNGALSDALPLARRYRDFPRFGAPQAVLNALSQAAPVFLFGALFGPAVVGYYWFTQRLLQLPNKLIGESVRQVFYQRATELHNARHNVHSLLVRATATMAVIGMIPMALLLLGGPPLFRAIFGSEWVTAGEYARWLSVWWFFAFINPPSVTLIAVFNLQKLHVVWEAALLVARVGAILVGAHLASALSAVALLAIVGAMFNASLVSFIVGRTFLAGRRESRAGNSEGDVSQ